MIVCLCASVTERQLVSVVANGASTVREIGRQCGAGVGCGACKPLIRECLAMHRAQQDDEATAGPRQAVEVAPAAAATVAPA